jgi:hypothetical protein
LKLMANAVSWELTLRLTKFFFMSDCSGKIAVPAPSAPFAVTPINQARIVADMIFPQQWENVV